METDTTGETVVPESQGDIVFSSVLSAFTQFIPLPFVDGYVERQVHNRMIHMIMETHNVKLDKKEVRKLLKGPPGRPLRAVARKITMITLKRVVLRALRNTLIVFDLKFAADSFGATYHLGYLLDYAFQRHWEREVPPEKLRAAVDRICAETHTSPVENAVRDAFAGALSLLDDARKAVVAFLSGKSAGDTSLDEPGALPESAEFRNLTERMQSALTQVPPGYFRDLRIRLARELDLPPGEAPA